MSTQPTTKRQDQAGNWLYMNTTAGFASHDETPAAGVYVIRIETGPSSWQYCIANGSTAISAMTFVTTPNIPSAMTIIAQGSRTDYALAETFGDITTHNSSEYATAAQGATADSAVQPGDLAAVATTGAYADLSGRPTLATVATTGAYSDLTGTPTIPAAQVNSDWSASSGVAQVLNKPSSMAPSGSAGGHLMGTYPNPTLIGELVHRVYAGGALKSGVFQCITSATSSGGTVTFNLTTDGTSGGTPIFSSIYASSIAAWVNDTAVDFRCANPVLSGDKKTLTLDVAQRIFTGITVLGTNVLGSTQLVNLSGGTMVHLSILGE